MLEIGFGGGALLAAIRSRTGGRVYGVDHSAAAVARGKQRFGDAVGLFAASADALPLANASVHKACSVNNIYFWPDPKRAMAELARVIRPSGRLAIAFEPPEELRKWPGHRYGFRLYEEGEVRTLMERAGFRDIVCTEGRGRKPDRFLCLTGTRGAAEAAR